MLATPPQGIGLEAYEMELVVDLRGRGRGGGAAPRTRRGRSLARTTTITGFHPAIILGRLVDDGPLLRTSRL